MVVEVYRQAMKVFECMRRSLIDHKGLFDSSRKCLDGSHCDSSDRSFLCVTVDLVCPLFWNNKPLFDDQLKKIRQIFIWFDQFSI